MNVRTVRLALAALAVAASLRLALPLLAPAPAVAEAAPSHGLQRAVLAGGCFWGMEAVFESLRGVTNVEAGYAGGARATAHYEMVGTGLTGHAESVEVTFDPKRISYAQLLAVYFSVAHDPTELNRQGPDEGTQYRSEIFYADEAQHRTALATIARLDASKTFAHPIVTKVEALHGFYAAEEYHQHFVQRNPDYPYVVVNDKPKLQALAERFPALVKSQS